MSPFILVVESNNLFFFIKGRERDSLKTRVDHHQLGKPRIAYYVNCRNYSRRM